MFAHYSTFIRQTWRCTVPGLVLVLTLAALNNVSAEESLAVAIVEQRDTPKLFVADAVIEAVHQATMAAETTGRIKQIFFDVDDLVEKGAILLRFTDKEQQAGVARAEAQLKEALARLQQAEDEHTRIQSVFEKKLVAKSAVDKTLADVKAARQRVKAAEADNKKAQEQLEYTVVRAPYAGIVVERHVNEGERVQPGTPLMTGFSLAQLRATANVPQTVVEAVRQHGKVTISLNGTKAGTTDERVNSVSSDKLTVYPFANPKSHDFTVRAELSAVPAGFYPGMFAKARFVVGQVSRLIVPIASVVHRSEVTAVYVVDKQGRVEFRAVRVGAPADDGAIEVLAGLGAGEQVALDPVKAGVLLKAQRKQ
jgi:RND family efflux transporter MFP subunit